MKTDDGNYLLNEIYTPLFSGIVCSLIRIAYFVKKVVHVFRM